MESQSRLGENINPSSKFPNSYSLPWGPKANFVPRAKGTLSPGPSISSCLLWPLLPSLCLSHMHPTLTPTSELPCPEHMPNLLHHSLSLSLRCLLQSCHCRRTFPTRPVLTGPLHPFSPTPSLDSSDDLPPLVPALYQVVTHIYWFTCYLPH